MKTLFTFTIGVIVTLFAVHYYHNVKTVYFNDLYKQYSAANYSYLTQQPYMTQLQFEKKWLDNQPWCFKTPTKNFCNASSPLRENEEYPKNELVELHQKLVNWYPKAKASLTELYAQALAAWEKQNQGGVRE